MLICYSTVEVILNSTIFGVSPSEPHIDGDNGPRPRGTYLSIYVARGAFATSTFPRSHVYALTVPHDVVLTWRDSNQDSATTRRLGNAWIDFYKARVYDNEQESHLITEVYDWSDKGNTRGLTDVHNYVESWIVLELCCT